ncbi:MAG TPA: TadE/TadG family type IV pilus assembly protein [Allosphingosinicella sp.]|uniref:TadE/TadG family type IV pilus assembly protein n=1 Tax=Allosphingosinicella sp. TaxID=2823234 RepID=UPI002EDAA943
MGLKPLLAFARDSRGAAAAEMALVTPLLLGLMLSAFELGKYFMDEHVVAKAVRDSARYAARRSFSDFVDGGGNCAVDNDVQTKARNIARTGQIADGGTARLGYWTDPATIAVSVACDTSGSYTGIYTGNAAGAPVVTVSASVPYMPLLGSIGLDTGGMVLNAQSQAAVTGI